MRGVHACVLTEYVKCAHMHAAHAGAPCCVCGTDMVCCCAVLCCACSMRLLRPQALVQEEAIRFWATTTAYRSAARTVAQFLTAYICIRGAVACAICSAFCLGESCVGIAFSY